MNDSPLVRLIFVCACVAGLSAARAGAQAPKPSAARCDTVLTRAEALAIVEVQRADGVTRMIFYEIAEDKILAR